jgi:hypothetical protein
MAKRKKNDNFIHKFDVRGTLSEQEKALPHYFIHELNAGVIKKVGERKKSASPPNPLLFFNVSFAKEIKELTNKKKIPYLKDAFKQEHCNPTVFPEFVPTANSFSSNSIAAEKGTEEIFNQLGNAPNNSSSLQSASANVVNFSPYGVSPELITPSALCEKYLIQAFGGFLQLK